MRRRKRYSKSPEIILYMIGTSLLTAIVMVWCAQLGFIKLYLEPTKFYIPSEAFLLIVSTLSVLGFAKQKSKGCLLIEPFGIHWLHILSCCLSMDIL